MSTFVVLLSLLLVLSESLLFTHQLLPLVLFDCSFFLSLDQVFVCFCRLPTVICLDRRDGSGQSLLDKEVIMVKLGNSAEYAFHADVSG